MSQNISLRDHISSLLSPTVGLPTLALLQNHSPITITPLGLCPPDLSDGVFVLVSLGYTHSLPWIPISHALCSPGPGPGTCHSDTCHAHRFRPLCPTVTALLQLGSLANAKHGAHVYLLR